MDISDYIIEEDLVYGRDNLLVSHDWLLHVQEESLLKAKDGYKDDIFAPQAGFQEKVLECEADVLIIGGKRGGGKTFVMGLTPAYDMHNPLFSGYGFRKEEGDLQRGLIKSIKPIYNDVALYKESSLMFEFKNKATLKFEHLQNENEIDRRFRGVEMPLILIDELPQISEKTFFTLLASNRNTIGARNKFIASCNPVGKKHWVYKLISWYIDEDTGEIYPERDGKIRYLFRASDSVDDVIWGNSKEEVYLKGKEIIDDYLGEGESYEDLIISICFIEGDYSNNKIFKVKDPSYKGRLAAQGGKTSRKDIKGIWMDEETSSTLLKSSDFENMFNNFPQTTGVRHAVADVALKEDFFVIGAFDGRHLYDIEYFHHVTSDQAIDYVKKFLEKHDIREENFAYDANGIGLYLEGFFKKSYKFNNKQPASNPKLWNNQKSECAERFTLKVKELKYSVDKSVLDRRINKTGQTVEERLQKEREALQRKETDNGRFEIISKPQMKLEIGHSPDFIEMMFMLECFGDKIKQRKNIGML